MTIKSGYKANLKMAGKPLAFTNEDTITSDLQTFEIIDSLKKIFDHQSPITVYVDSGRVTNGYIVERASGRVRFNEKLTPGSVVTISGSYVTTSKIGKVNSMNFDVTREVYDITSFTEEYRSALPGIKSGSGSFTDFDVTNPLLLDALNSDYLLIEIFDDYTDEKDPIRAWAIISSNSLKASVTEAQTREISFDTTGYFTH